MKVSGTGRTHGGGAVQRSARSGAASRGEATFRVGDLDRAEAVRAASGAAAAAPVDALIALQEVDDATVPHRHAIARAETILDILDDLKIALLEGRVPRERLAQLLRLVERRRESHSAFIDPRLAHVLDEIELRARVELAKYERLLSR